ncbi:PREDICTED: aarF domain-containing protein kinase 4 [Rhagoletis zephyria]|uniref:aarF domain-containing protein kinase 4 n=1 Tax=Rhagoletis zephyria TaxID=28612 RepID=UPI00081165DD|nr:PREDICTED: aarF domain-containing protein kinase 4 [Rhagoletis zephyria]XP_017480709.1 PREDICTED: aarF domain-containing protein kinase 4 [Rhagoletis zephyria]
MARSAQDALAVLRGIQLVAEALCREQSAQCKQRWSQSSIRELLQGNFQQSANYLQQVGTQPTEELKKLQQLLQETSERTCVVIEGLRQLSLSKVPNELRMTQQTLQRAMSDVIGDAGIGKTAGEGGAVKPSGTVNFSSSNAGAANAGKTGSPLDATQLDISSITLQELEEILSKRNKNRDISLRTPSTEHKQVKDVTVQPTEAVTLAAGKTPTAATTSANTTATATSTTTAAANPISSDALKADTVYVENILKTIAGDTSAPDSGSTTSIELPTLSKVAKQRRVPSSRLGRMVSFGGLFAGLGVGTINELTKGALGLGGSKNLKEALLSPANAERIVDTLCKVRGAALKIGQILSIQDSKVVSPQLAKAFERVRHAADYMPDWQVERVMITQLGADWRNLLESFDEKPFAAASIGQVHRATLKDGMQVAIKIQYPGVAQSIESDIDNLVGMLKVWDVFPHGFFIDNVVKVAKRELNWEVDYTREAEYTDKFKQMIAPYHEYYVPKVIKELTTSSVLTTELVPGVPLDKCFDLSYEHRHHIASSILKLCLRELFELECMQTDPNWSNFLYDVDTKRLMLIDFGSTRFYQKQFIRNYRQVIMHAAENNREGVLRMSREMGFLTGYETKQMEEAHVDAVMILGEIFRFDGDFDFGRQNTTERIAHLVPTMVAHRLCPPPEEIYSIHRKLSGIFLLCSRLNVRLNCRPYYDEIVIQKFKE